jgi:hypothetical protein
MTMMPRMPLLLVAALAVLLSPVMGWVPRIELVSKKGRISFTGLRAVEDSDDETLEAYRAKLESRFSGYGDHAHDFFSESRLLVNDDEDSWIESEWFDESTMPCEGDCEVSETKVRVLLKLPLDAIADLSPRLQSQGM